MEKKVLFIHHGSVIGGAPVSLSLQVKGIINNDQIGVTIASHNKDMMRFFRKKGIPSIPWIDPCVLFGKIVTKHSNINKLRTLLEFLKEYFLFPFSICVQTFLLLKREEKIVHLNSSVLISTGIAAKISRKKIVWHIREASYFPPLISFLIYLLSDHIICISPVELSRFSYSPKKMSVIYNPVNFTQFDYHINSRQEVLNELCINDEALVIITLGGVNPRKGTLEIIKGVMGSDRDCHLLVIGPPPQYSNNDAYSAKILDIIKTDIKHKVKFLGILEDPAPYLSAADILISFGLTPHFSRPIFEAWAMKKPVIVNNMDGISSYVDHGANGMIISEPLDINLTRCLDNEFYDREYLKKIGEAGYKKSGEYMALEVSVNKLENVLNNLFTNE